MADHVKRTDYLSQGRKPEDVEEHYGMNMNNGDYLGGGPGRLGQQGHLREQSIETHDEGYDIGQGMIRDDSRSPLHHPDDHQLPAGAAEAHQSYLTPPPPASTTQSNTRVHYPPSPYLATTEQHYTTVPLNDHANRSHSDLDVSNTNSPLPTSHSINTNFGPPVRSNPGSGANTPSGSGNKRKPWSFLPLHQSNASLESGMNEKSGKNTPKRPKPLHRPGSWDLLGDRAEWEEYNPAQASVENLRFAEGDVGTNKLSRLYYWALNRSIVVRWILYIVPILGILWIPGIVGLAGHDEVRVWGVQLLYWSIWLTVLWCGFWAATAAFLILPSLWRNIVGSIIPTARRYEDVIKNLGRYAKLIAWMWASWISFTPIVINHYSGDQTSDSRNNLTTMVNILFGLALCTVILGAEKLVIQLIAFQFHQDSYEDRLKEQKFNLKCLTTLYINSRDIPGRSDTMIDTASHKTKGSQLPKVAIRKALKGLKSVAQTTTTALGNVASEMAGQSVLQTNSPANRVTAALNSANKSKALARRIYYSYRQPGVDHIDIRDIARFFPDLETAQAALEVLDKDGNGDATRDEIEAALLSIHRERLSLEASMRDLDGAVRRLDDIFLVLVFAISALIIAATITTKITTLVTSAGTFILGLSWLIGSTMQEILLACIFLFVKHPYDVGDRIDVDDKSYTVVKMALMSTNFKRTDGKFVWIGHNILATKVIENVRRSGPTSETFTFDVDFGTSFESLQTLRARMLAFCKENARDFLPIFDVVVDDIPGQGKMVLKADIRYKSNWQQGALKVQRRNKWICALKMILSDIKIFGPAGAGNPSPDPADPTRYTVVPWEEVHAAEIAAQRAKPQSPPPSFAAATHADKLTDKRNVITDPSQDIWDEADDLIGHGSVGPSRPGTPGATIMFNPMESALAGATGHSQPGQTPTTGSSTAAVRARYPHAPVPGEHIEMTSAPVNRRGVE